ncbi:MAG TPA: GtrA family protein [Clostridiales bacterium]|nr:GtrA family protein [Clostridiales bacterium]
MEKWKVLWQKYKEILLYLVFGGLTTLVSWGSYALFERLLNSTGINHAETLFSRFDLNAAVTIANLLSWICAVAFAYITNKLWVFESKSWAPKIVWREIITFVTARLATGVLEWVGVPFLVKVGLKQTIFGVEGAWAKILVSVLVVILNYIFSKLIIFRKEKKNPKQEETPEQEENQEQKKSPEQQENHKHEENPNQ